MSSDRIKAIESELEGATTELQSMEHKRSRAYTEKRKVLKSRIEHLKEQLNHALLQCGGPPNAHSHPSPPQRPSGQSTMDQVHAAPNLGVACQFTAGPGITRNDTQANGTQCMAPQVSTADALSLQATATSPSIVQTDVGIVANDAGVNAADAPSQFPTPQVSNSRALAINTPVTEPLVIQSPYEQNSVLAGKTPIKTAVTPRNISTQPALPVTQNPASEALANNTTRGTEHDPIGAFSNTTESYHQNSEKLADLKTSAGSLVARIHSGYGFSSRTFVEAEMENVRLQTSNGRSRQVVGVGGQQNGVDSQLSTASMRGFAVVHEVDHHSQVRDMQESALSDQTARQHNSPMQLQTANGGDPNWTTGVHQNGTPLYGLSIDAQRAARLEDMVSSANSSSHTEGRAFEDRYSLGYHGHLLNASSNYTLPIASPTFNSTAMQSQHSALYSPPSDLHNTPELPTSSAAPGTSRLSMRAVDGPYLMSPKGLVMASGSITTNLPLPEQCDSQTGFPESNRTWDDFLLTQVEEGALGLSTGMEEIPSMYHSGLEHGIHGPSKLPNNGDLDIYRTSPASCPSKSLMTFGTSPSSAGDDTAAAKVDENRALANIPSPRVHENDSTLRDALKLPSEPASAAAAIKFPDDREIKALCDSPQLKEARERVLHLKQTIADLESSLQDKVAVFQGFEKAYEKRDLTMNFSTLLAETSALESSMTSLKADIDTHSTQLQDSETFLAQISQHEFDRVSRLALKEMLGKIQVQIDEVTDRLDWTAFTRLGATRAEARERLAAVEKRLSQSSAKFGSGVETGRSTTASVPKGKAGGDLKSHKKGPEDGGAPRKRKVLQHDSAGDESNYFVEGSERETRPVKKTKASKKADTRTELKKDEDNDGNTSRDARISASRIKALAGKVGHTDKKKKCKKNTSYDADTYDDEDAWLGDECPIPGLTEAEFQELEREGKLQLSEFLLAPAPDKIHPSIKLLALKYQGFLVQSSYQRREIALAIHSFGPNDLRCRYHIKHKAGKTYDGAGKYLVEGIGYAVDPQSESRMDLHMNCGCPIDAVLLDFFFWKTWTARSSNPAKQMEEGMNGVMIPPRLRSYVCQEYCKSTRLTLDDIYNWSTSGVPFKIYTAVAQAYRLIKELQEAGVTIDVGQEMAQSMRRGNTERVVASGVDATGQH